jgi:hypothetical protein
MSSISSTIISKINSGKKLDSNDVSSPEFANYVQE